MNLQQINSLYFIGIGGIGMSAIARYFLSKGAKVSGYDKTPTQLTKQLATEGADIHYEENISLIPKQVDVVVYTPAIPQNHAEFVYYKENNYTVVKRSDILQWISNNSFNVCVAGTHGKTTTSAMIGHLLRHSGIGCSAFLGGIATNYNTNFWSSANNVVVVEADEYDRSFLKLSPDIAIITSMDADHLDIYGTAEEVENAFISFAGKTKAGGTLIYKSTISRKAELKADNLIAYNTANNDFNCHVTQWQVINGSYVFDVKGNNFTLEKVELNMGGIHNIENALAAILVGKTMGLSDEAIKAGIASFSGVKRRFEFHLKTSSAILIDDYAHHPQELTALLNGVKSLYPNLPITIVFQPHLYSRTQDQANGFAECLQFANKVILLPIYPARELPIEGVNSEMIANKMGNHSVKCLSKQAAITAIKDEKPTLVVLAGAGDIDLMINDIKQIMLEY
ncbi:MAG: UDP-N-acetylmuramate--L-alanine ligase [Chitinophagaceae bacterium]